MRALAATLTVATAMTLLDALANAQECATNTTSMCSDLSGALLVSNLEVEVASRTDCTICTTESPFVTSFDACCSSGVSPTSSCREILLDLPASSADVRPSSVASVDAGATLTIPVTMSQIVTAEHSCSRTCMLYGDPEGVSFCGEYSEFVLCDGRIDDGSEDTCTQSKEVCESRLDYYGNACVYLPDVPNSTWVDFDVSGSPCQMDLSVNPAPVQLMYSRRPLQANNGPTPFAVYAEIGERGIIPTIIIEYDGVNASLSANDCIASNGSWDAWVNGDAIREFGNYTVQEAEAQVVYTFLIDDTMGLRLLCQRMGPQRARWDVDNLYVLDTAEQAATTSKEDGYCVTSEMSMGKATQSSTENFHSLCMATLSPNMLVCRTLSKECTSDTYMTTVKAWCDGLNPELRPNRCIQRIKKQIKRELAGQSSSSVWSDFFCQVLGDHDKTLTQECKTKVENFGFPEVFAESGYTLSQVTAATACDMDASLAVSSEECFEGLHVQIETEDGSRETIASVPVSRLVCDEPLVLTGADYPEAFVYTVYLVQCGLSEICNLARGHRPVAAVEVAANDFITMEYSQEATAASGPTVCADDVSDIVSSCPTQCCRQENDGAPICLNVTVSSTAFCDADTAPDGVDCADIVNSSAYVDITIEPQEDSEDEDWLGSCCRTCAGWGDPILLPFDSSEKVKWIQCDGRKENCAFGQKVCENQVDHLGNACVWNQTVDDLVVLNKSPTVAFFGSPCQVNWTAAADADWLPNVTMFENEDFSMRLFTGERSVLTGLELELTSGGYHHFDPAGCFHDDSITAADAWTSYEGAPSTPAKSGFSVTCGDVDMNGLERPCAVTHQDSSVFIQFRCIRASLDGDYDGMRINVQGISEYLPYSSSGGFCYDGNLDNARGESSINEAGEACGLDEDEAGTHISLNRICKDIFHPTCTVNEIEAAVESWCKYSAILKLKDKLTCASDIINGTKHSLEVRWRNYFCMQFPNGKYSKCQKDYTKFLDVTPTRDLCFSSIDELEAFGRDPCMAGVSVMNIETDQEILFLPEHIPPCDNVLRVPASEKYADLFTSKIEFVKCGVQPEQCPYHSALPGVFCDPIQSYSVQLTYSAGDLCPDAS
ncbi:Hypothetical Protein FCC1311_080662 [Hondaea fermentalgiana]|uniref:Uncharacterized protein n=1 Tax=Hondaea fermentalgiana TaxID=2315210 RepID=A0A2R5GTX5_9STRA|nr:Hypothetical Protein FCC1311_080662 [Hondaea fermentalgiana]|eukprot:GBG31841.1 Hypothetical Protein FCC1311_080662 [Hondaea fermentalgiana]